MLEPDFDAIPQFLRDLPYWSAWPAIPRENGKIGKRPLGINGKFNQTNNPAGWVNFDIIRTFYETNQGKNFSYNDKSGEHQGRISGVGILLDQSLSLVGIDFDSVIDVDGNIINWAQPFIQELQTITYCEVSPSGKGIRAFIRGKKPTGRCRRGDLELYDDKRFLTVTGHKLSDCPNEPGNGPDAQTIIDKLVNFITNSQENISTKGGSHNRQTAQSPNNLTDQELLNKARNASDGYYFRKLFDDGDTSKHNGDHSASDMALCLKLAYWTGKYADRMDRLFRQSALMRGDKWDRNCTQGMTYGQVTISRAISDCKSIYDPENYKRGKNPDNEKIKGTSKSKSEDKKNDFLYSEDALSLIFEDKYKDSLRYDHTRKAWYGWNGTYWQLDETGRAYELIRKICRNAAKDTGPKEAFYLKKASTASAVNKFAQNAQHMAVTHKIWDADDFLLGTPGGVVDLKTGQLMPGKRDCYITKITSVTPADKSDAPLWFKFLNEATNEKKDLQRFMQQICGMCLTGCTREHVLFFVYGDGGNGKSVFIGVISNILGHYSITAAMETFSESKTDRHRTELAVLNGARLVTVSETEEGRAWAEGKIKSFTGGDVIRANFMRCDTFEFKPKAKLIIVGNHKPELRNVDDAMRRRINIIPFTHKPKEVDEKLPEKLQAEYPAILRWMIEGCLDWQNNGLQRPLCVTEATQEYFDSQDIFGQWLDECCTTDAYSGTSATLFGSWKKYAEENGLHAGTQKSFAGEMGKRGFKRIRDTKGKRAFEGISIKVEKNQEVERGCPNDF